MTWRRPAMSWSFRLMRRRGFRRHRGLDGSGPLFRSLLRRLFRSRLLGSFLDSLLGRLLHGLLGFLRGLLRGFFDRLLGGLFLRSEKLFSLLRLLAFLLLRFSHVVLLLR